MHFKKAVGVAAIAAFTMSVTSCRVDSGNASSEEKDLSLLASGSVKRLLAMQGRHEVVVYYANETRNRADEQVAMHAYIGALKASRSTKEAQLGSNLELDQTLFPSTVKTETTELDRLICKENVNPGVSGLVVFTNELFLRGSYQYCTSGQGGLQEMPFGQAMEVTYGKPAASPQSVEMALAAAKKHFSEADTVYSMIFKSHGSADKIMADCYPAFFGALSVPLARSVLWTPQLNPKDMGIEGGQYPKMGTAEKPLLGTEEREKLGVEGSKKGSDGMLGLECQSRGSTIDDMYQAFKSFEVTGATLGVIFLESCQSAILTGVNPPQATIWGSDRKGLEYRTIKSYASILTAKTADGKPQLFAVGLHNQLVDTCLKQHKKDTTLACRPFE